MLIRVRTPDGQLRIELPAHGTLGALYAQVATHLAPESASSFTLLNAKQQPLSRTPDMQATPLSALHVQHGDLLTVRLMGDEVSGKAHAHPSSHPPHASSTHQNTSTSTSTSSSSSSSSSSRGGSDVDMQDPSQPINAAADCGARVPDLVEEKVDSIEKLSRQWTMKEYLAYKERFAIRIEPQSAVVPKVSLDARAAQSLQTYLVETGYTAMRLGYLFGTVLPNKEVRVAAIWEPPQHGAPDHVALLEDPMTSPAAAHAMQVARALGLVRVGWLLTHRERAVPLTAGELLHAAQLMAVDGDASVTVTVVIKDDGSVAFEAFQCATVLAQLARKGYVEPKDGEDSVLALAASRKVFVDKKEVSEFDVHRVTVVVPIGSWDGPFTAGAFPIENRGVLEGQTVAQGLQLWVRAGKPLADFHFLLWLTQHLFTMDGEGAALVEAVKSQRKDEIDNWKMIVEQYAGL